MKVINLFGGPSTGKSTTAAGLYFLFQLDRLEVELISEYAKYLVWSDRVKMFREQTYIFAKQNHKLEILRNKVDWAITDSPLLLSSIYGREVGVSEAFHNFVDEMYNTYDNITVLLNRKSPYQPNGRNQTEDQAIIKDQECKQLLDNKGIDYINIDATPQAPWDIYRCIMGKPHRTSLLEK
jgi:nicotinamide riboside kinase